MKGCLAMFFAWLALATGCSPAAVPLKTATPVARSASQAAEQMRRSLLETAGPRVLPTPSPRGRALRAELVASGLELPSNLVFTPDGRLLLTEVTAGRVRIIDRDGLSPDPLFEVERPVRPEAGLLGLALAPDFARSNQLYLYYSQSRDGLPWRNRVIRVTIGDGRAGEPVAVLDNLPIGDQQFNGGHNGGRLGFGPDGKLWITVGNAGDDRSTQKLSALHGKVLRINPDGAIPADNPIPTSPVYAYGFRNPWGLAFQPGSGVAYVSDNGEREHDEINRVQPGGNYGWPVALGTVRRREFVDPLWDSYEERGGMTGLTFYSGNLFDGYQGDLLFCRFTQQLLMRARLDRRNPARLTEVEPLADGCALDVAVGPDGAIYCASVNAVWRLLPAI